MEKPDLYVIARFLGALYNSDSPLRKTNLQLLVRLNYPRFLEYLEWLTDHGLVVRVSDSNGNELITLSPKGIEARHKLVGWITETMKNLEI